MLPNRLPVMGATRTGATTLAAFHRALEAVGVGSYNLIRLSSVIPPGLRMDSGPTASAPVGTWGDRLYCVYAEHRTSIPGAEAWAGVGWVQRLEGGGGWLVEHEGGSEDFVSDAINHSLQDMVAGSDGEFTAPEFVLSGGRCDGQPLCALVMVPFSVVPWSDGR